MAALSGEALLWGVHMRKDKLVTMVPTGRSKKRWSIILHSFEPNFEVYPEQLVLLLLNLDLLGLYLPCLLHWINITLRVNFKYANMNSLM